MEERIIIADAAARSQSRRATLVEFEPDNDPWPDLGHRYADAAQHRLGAT